MPSSRGSSQPRDRTQFLISPALPGGFFTTSSTWETPGAIAETHNLCFFDLQLSAACKRRLWLAGVDFCLGRVALAGSLEGLTVL